MKSFKDEPISALSRMADMSLSGHIFFSPLLFFPLPSISIYFPSVFLLFYSSWLQLTPVVLLQSSMYFYRDIKAHLLHGRRVSSLLPIMTGSSIIVKTFYAWNFTGGKLWNWGSHQLSLKISPKLFQTEKHQMNSIHWLLHRHYIKAADSCLPHNFCSRCILYIHYVKMSKIVRCHVSNYRYKL